MTSGRENDVTCHVTPRRIAEVRSFCELPRYLLIVAFVNAFLLRKSGEAVVHLGNEAIWRDNEDQVKKAIFIIDPTQRVQSNGTVIGWNVYTTRGRRSQVVFLQIWRPVHSTANRFVRTGETRITALWVGYNNFLLFPVDRISVQSGDVLGIYFPNYNPIPFSTVHCAREGSEHLFRYNPYRFQAVGDEVAFERGSSDSNPCRRYSLNATIMNDDEVKLFDYDYQETTDGRYDRRPYGAHAQTKRLVCCRSTSFLRHRCYWTALLLAALVVAALR